MRLSEHFTLEEMLRSDTAKRKHISNETKDPQIIENLKLLCQNVLEPIREMIGRPIIITSGYRCPALNKAVGGNKVSQHMLGQAADFIVKGCSRDEMYLIGKKIKASNIIFDQLGFEGILEPSIKTDWKRGVAWLHISYRSGHNRKETFYA